MNESEKTITVTRQQLIDTSRIMSGLATSLMRLSVRGERPHEIIEKLAADVFDGIIAVPFAPTQSAVNQAAGETARTDVDWSQTPEREIEYWKTMAQDQANIVRKCWKALNSNDAAGHAPWEAIEALWSQLAKLSAERDAALKSRNVMNEWHKEEVERVVALERDLKVSYAVNHALSLRINTAETALAAALAMVETMRGANRISVEQAAEELHEYFEWVRSDSLAVPDSDKTEAIIRRAITSHKYVRPEFVAAMDAELISNERKGDWNAFVPKRYDAKAWMKEHTDKLFSAIEWCDQKQVSEFAADVANIAMKIEQHFGATALSQVPPTAKGEERP